MAKATYKDAGVDLDVYREAMARLPRLLSRTYTPRVIPLEGGFAGLFQLDFTNQLFARRYKDPVLVSCTDGVGTKLKVAVAVGRHDTVGIDLVAMSVNDALVLRGRAAVLPRLCGHAQGRSGPAGADRRRASRPAASRPTVPCLGGETAILPDMYAPGDYDLAGFCVGVAEKERVIDGRAIEPDDLVIGVASTGLHSNGFSLARKIAFDIAGHKIDDHVEELGTTVGEALLTPTQIYVRPVRKVLTYYRVKNVVHGIAHITGGGLHENLERILPEGIQVVIDRGSWPMPPVFTWLQRLGEVDQAEMDQVFNMGIGLVLIVAPFYAESIRHQLSREGLKNWLIGRVEKGPRGVVWGKM